MPLGEQIARQVTATDQTSRAIHYQRLEAEAKKQFPAKEAAAPPQVAPEDSGCVRVIAAANRSGHLTHPIGRQGAWEPFNELRFWQGHDEVSAQARDTWQTSFHRVEAPA